MKRIRHRPRVSAGEYLIQADAMMAQGTFETKYTYSDPTRPC
ncbi:MAG: hypothetical protein VB034_04230 [Eubacteriales bacterium]|nr:hypothetical protein [Eubacteriales bacterium]